MLLSVNNINIVFSLYGTNNGNGSRIKYLMHLNFTTGVREDNQDLESDSSDWDYQADLDLLKVKLSRSTKTVRPSEMDRITWYLFYSLCLCYKVK